MNQHHNSTNPTPKHTLKQAEQKYKRNKTAENKYNLACCMQDTKSLVRDSLNLFIELYNDDSKNNLKFPQLLAKITIIYIQIGELKNAEMWSNKWVNLQPDNKKAKDVQEFLVFKLKSGLNSDKTEDDFSIMSYFTKVDPTKMANSLESGSNLKKFFIFVLAVLAFNWFYPQKQ